MQFSEKHANLRADLIKMTQKYESMWDGHLERSTVAQKRIALYPPGASPAQSAAYRAGSKQRNLGGKEVAQMEKACVVEPVVD